MVDRETTERSNEDNFAPMEDASFCQCCGGRTGSDAYCMQCHHQFNEWCARGSGHCDDCGAGVYETGQCSRCGHVRTHSNSQAQKPTNCSYCGFMLDVDGTCIRDRTHGQTKTSQM